MDDPALARRIRSSEVVARIRVTRKGIEVTKLEDKPWLRWCLALENGLGYTHSTDMLLGARMKKGEPVLISWELIPGWQRDTQTIHIDLAVEDGETVRMSNYVWEPRTPGDWTLPPGS